MLYADNFFSVKKTYLQSLKIITIDFATKYKLTALRNAFAAAFESEDDTYLQSISFADTKEIDEKDAIT